MLKKKYQFSALLAILLFSNCTPYFEIPYDTASYDISSIGPFDCSREYSIAKDEASGRYTSREIARISPDGRTKLVIKYYRASTFKWNQWNPYSSLGDSKRSNRLSISVDADEVIVGGGAAVLSEESDNWWLPSIYDGKHQKTKALLTSSYPVDDNTFSKWAADSKDFEFPEPAFNHHLDVYAVGMKIFFDGIQIPVSTLRANMEIAKEKKFFDSDKYKILQSHLPITTNFTPLSVGMKSCWSGNRGGIYLNHLGIYSDPALGQNSVYGGCVSFNGENKINGYTELYGLSIRNINPINPSKTLLDIQVSIESSKNSTDFKSVSLSEYTDIESMIISAFGDSGYYYGSMFRPDTEYFDWGMMALFAYSHYKLQPYGILNVGGHGDGQINEQISYLKVVKILPGK